MSETTWTPGMACRDPETGRRYRYTPTCWVRETWEKPGNAYACIPHTALRIEPSPLLRAMDAGPDLTDFATAAVYAAQRGWSIAHGYDDGTVRVLGHRGTLPEAVQAAAKAEGGER